MPDFEDGIGDDRDLNLQNHCYVHLNQAVVRLPHGKTPEGPDAELAFVILHSPKRR